MTGALPYRCAESMLSSWIRAPDQAAGSSLLFPGIYEFGQTHLNTNGILQMWFPVGTAHYQAVASLDFESFPCAGFSSIEAGGCIFWPPRSQSRFLSPKRWPPACRSRPKKICWNDQSATFRLMSPGVTMNTNSPQSEFGPSIQVTDDQPYNEYFLLRRMHQ